MSEEDGVPVVLRDRAEAIQKICRAYRVPPWIVGVAPRPRWPRRVWYWVRGYRPGSTRFVPIMPPRMSMWTRWFPDGDTISRLDDPTP